MFTQMLHVAKKCFVASLLVVAFAGSAFAQFGNGDPNRPPSGGVPEMDPSSLVSAAALLGGGALLLVSRRKSQPA